MRPGERQFQLETSNSAKVSQVKYIKKGIWFRNTLRRGCREERELLYGLCTTALLQKCSLIFKHKETFVYLKEAYDAHHTPKCLK